MVAHVNTTTILFLLSACISSFCLAQRLHVKHISPKLKHSTYQTELLHIDNIPQNTWSNGDPKTAALSFVTQTLNLSPRDYRITSAYTSEKTGVTHVYLRQIYQGLEVSNGNMNINVGSKGNIISYGNSFFPFVSLDEVKPWFSSDSGFISPARAFNTLSNHLGLNVQKNLREIAIDGLGRYELDGIKIAEERVKVEQTYLQLSSTKLVPAWKFNLRLSDNWFDAWVQADGSKVIALNDWISEASYKVVKIGKNDPRDGRDLVVNPEDSLASPLGWHREDNNTSYNSTHGNNVIAQENWANKKDYLGHYRPSSDNQVYDFSLDDKKEPKKNIDAAITNLFYVCNRLHDIFYQYGFNEAAGNFQTNNFGKGGKGNDSLIANAQDGSGLNSANFATPPDGINGRMRMYLFNKTDPKRDGSLENDIIIHEFGHGISTRLTGGPDNSNCLDDDEPSGMGEGWSDFFAIMFRMTAEYNRTTDAVIADYVLNDTKGIRTFPYSTNMTTNPTVYDYISRNEWREFHKIGEIWCNVLWEAYWNLADVCPNHFNPALETADLTSANTLLLQLVIDGLKLQPCFPNFITGRDAILKALDLAQVQDKPKLSCAIWKAFAKRGVGTDALDYNGKGGVTAGFKIPNHCQ